MSRRPGDAGFSLIEQIIAMALIVGALLGLLSTLGAAAQGVTTSRQRTIAVSLAKQVIENLQGAAYTSVAMSLTGLTSDPLVSGTAPNLVFESEPIVLGGTQPYRTTLTEVGTTFALRTFVTAVAVGGAGYRRVTVIVEWPSTSPTRTMRFSSLVFPLDYASFPASSGEAEATGGLITVDGSLGGDAFDDVHVVLPGARVDTNASTLRTSIAAAVSAASLVDVATGPVTTSACTAPGSDVGECVRQTLESVADNDSTSSTGNWVAGVGQTFVAGSLTTPGGATIVTPAGTMTSRASTDVCGPCGFGDSDGLPWADSSATTTTSSTARFESDHGVGSLKGSLWTLSNAWSPTVSVDHDATGNGIVMASAQLAAPALRVLELDGAPAGYQGAVKVGAFTAKASAASGYTLVAPAFSGTTTAQLQLWDGAAYRTVNVVPGTALDTTATASFTIGDHVVTFNSRVQSQGSTFSTVGTAPRSDAAAQHPSILVITVDVTITSATLVETPPTTTTIPGSTTTTTVAPTTTTTTTTVPMTTIPGSTTTTTTTVPVTTTTVAAVPLQTDSFSIVVDYGRVSAHDTWLAKAA
jgi:type II secretory pathway pseudopilin PulG